MPQTKKEKLQKNHLFIKDILNGMFDWVRVIDRDGNILFMNRSMSESVGCEELGMKCYEVLGKSAPCEGCISRKAIFEGQSHEKEEVFKGRIYSVMSSPLRNEEGEVIAAVEVLRDTTDMKLLQRRLVDKNKKMLEDLNIARKLQGSLLPKGLGDDRADFAFLYKPCEALGGDFLDIFKIDEDHIGFYIADVSGHGVPASMLTIFLQSSLDKRLLSPAAALEQLYREFNEHSFDSDMYITVFYAIVNISEHTMVYSNAGHNVCPILFNKDRFEILRVPGIPISSWLDRPGYVDRTAELCPGDRIFLYTDGIIEMKNSRNEQFGEERLLDILLDDASGPGETLNRIVSSAFSFAGISSTSVIADDITVALLEIK